MNRLLFVTAFLLGAAAVIWMGSTFVGSNQLALAVTVVIGGVYTIGFIELIQFRQATTTLASALLAIPTEKTGDITILEQWLARLHPSLQNPVRLRIEGERVGLPAPIITPYLVGLLVMLGLLGTFAGMVDTLRGAVFALEGTTELQAIRAGLAAPIEGLSLAFGTSVAGVATSAMLGLISTLSRRDRMLATRQLDTRVAAVFREFSLTHSRLETFKAIQDQAQALPEVAQKLEDMAIKLERMGDALGDKLIANQSSFHQAVTSSYTDLASSVGSSLKESLAESGRLAGDSIKPLLMDAMASISKETRGTHEQLTLTAREQLAALGRQFEHMSASMLESFDNSSSAWLESQQAGDKERLSQWADSLGQAQEQALGQLVDASNTFTTELKQLTDLQQEAFKSATTDFENLSNALGTQWLRSGEHLQALTTTLTNELGRLRTEEDQRGQAAMERLAALETTVASHLAALGKELEAPMTRLIETASETPRAAAEVIAQLRGEISNTIERDNQLLEERRQVMEQLNSLSDSLEQASAGQRKAVEQLVDASTRTLVETGARFTEKVDSELSDISEIMVNFSGSASEMASLGEAFSLAVNLYNESNTRLIDNLERIEESLDKSCSRSDEQMGYYVAQAREILDQSLLSQREVFEELQQLGQQERLVPAEAG
jgi:hypothetical protein